MQVQEHLEQKVGVRADEIDATVFTHLRWDHVQNMKQLKNTPYIAPKGEIEMAYNLLLLYYRINEANIGVEQAYAGCDFEAVEEETETLACITMFRTAGNSVSALRPSALAIVVLR